MYSKEDLKKICIAYANFCLAIEQGLEYDMEFEEWMNKYLNKIIKT